jgi:sec-independent protein translocase protein TatA
MFGIGSQELMVILLIAFFIFGAKRLPELGSSLGQAIRGFKKGMEGGANKLEPHETQNDEGTAKK